MSTINSKVAKSLPTGGPAAWLIGIFFGLLLLVNAAYTTAFGATFCGQVLKSSVLGGGMTVLFLDFAALCWFVARRYTAANKKQLDITKVMSIATLGGSCVMSLAQIGVSSAEKVSENMQWWVGFIGLCLVGLFAVANFVAAYFYQNYDPKELAKEKKRQDKITEDERQETIANRLKAEQDQLTDEADEASYEIAKREMHAAKPIIARRKANKYLNDHYRNIGMSDLIQYDDPTRTPPTPEPLTGAELRQLIADTIRAERLGAAAGAKKKSKKRGKKKSKFAPKATAPAPLPLESKTEPGKCKCGLSIGDAAGQCTAATCMIDQEAQATAIDRIHDVYVQEMGTKDGLSETYNQFAAKYADQFPNDGRANPKAHSFAWADYLTVLKEDALPLGADSYLRTDDEIALAEAAAASRLEADETPGK